MDWKDTDIGSVAKDMFMCQAMSTSFHIFHAKTGLSPQMVFKYGQQGLEIDLGFVPREPTPEEWAMFVEDVFESETFIMNSRLMKDMHQYSNIEALQIKTVETLKEIAAKRRDFYAKSN